jgi:hypothetical protein
MGQAARRTGESVHKSVFKLSPLDCPAALELHPFGYLFDFPSQAVIPIAWTAIREEKPNVVIAGAQDESM